MLEIAYGMQCTPSFASVWTPEVIASGLIATSPSVIGHTGSMVPPSTPILRAICSTEDGPIWLITCANTVLIESAVDWTSVCIPGMLPSALCTVQVWPPPQLWIVRGELLAHIEFGETPPSSAAASV